MLDNVASGKRLPEKNLVVLGGSVDSQRDFLAGLSTQDSRRNADRQSTKIPPIANSFALGYTYYDVLDADQDGMPPPRASLHHLFLNLLPSPNPVT